MIRTAEGVALGHPDKICDQISDAILDACLEQDPQTRAAIEVLGGHGIISVTGELTTDAYVNIREIAQQVYAECGYPNPIGVQVNVVEQSSQIADGVDIGGAGDQGIMVGYATRETPEFMPREVMLARQLARIMGARDGKSQVTLDDGNEIDTVVTSVCNPDAETTGAISLFLLQSPAVNWLFNPAGDWTVGGFEADTGLTGRKLAIDNYGPNVPLGGGCFSGKDATKVDRSAAYMARKIAVDYLERSGASSTIVHLAYAIGVAEPVMATVMFDDREVSENVTGYDLRPLAIIDRLGLRKPIFRETAKYGHFGNSFPWDRTDG